MQLPPHLAWEWPLHRIATSGLYQDSFHTLCTEWTLLDVLNANDVINAIEAARAEAQKEP